MSDTRLIYVSKGDAFVKNDKDGSFMNAVDEGVMVNVGDEISIEGIAVNSTGVGGEIIEVPERLKGYEYKTNAQVLNCMAYIHHNHQWGCMLPFITETNHQAINPTTYTSNDDKSLTFVKNMKEYVLPLARSR